MVLLEIKELNFGYKKGERVLKDISLTLNRGEIHALFGINGSGKSTLLKSIMGILKPDSGKIILEGKDIKILSQKERSKHIAYVPQFHIPSFPYTVEEFLIMGRNPYFSLFQTSPTKKEQKLVQELMASFNILHLKDRIYSELSGGELKLILLIRALVQKPKLLLLDEPMANLDLKNQYILWQVLYKLRAQGISILLTTHDPNQILHNCTIVTVIHNGKQIISGPPQKVITTEILSILFGEICKIESTSSNKKFIIVEP